METLSVGSGEYLVIAMNDGCGNSSAFGSLGGSSTGSPVTTGNGERYIPVTGGWVSSTGHRTLRFSFYWWGWHVSSTSSVSISRYYSSAICYFYSHGRSGELSNCWHSTATHSSIPHISSSNGSVSHFANYSGGSSIPRSYAISSQSISHSIVTRRAKHGGSG